MKRNQVKQSSSSSSSYPELKKRRHINFKSSENSEQEIVKKEKDDEVVLLKLSDSNEKEVKKKKRNEKEVKRKKHNEVELRRRKQIADLFKVMKELLQCTDKKRGSILAAAIDEINNLREQLKELSGENDATNLPVAFTMNKFSNNPIPTLVADIKGKIKACSNSLAQLLGYHDANHMRNQVIDIFSLSYDQESLTSLYSSISQLLNDPPNIDTIDCSIDLVTNDEDPISVRITIAMEDDTDNVNQKYFRMVLIPLKNHLHHSFVRKSINNTDYVVSNTNNNTNNNNNSNNNNNNNNNSNNNSTFNDRNDSKVYVKTDDFLSTQLPFFNS